MVREYAGKGGYHHPIPFTKRTVIMEKSVFFAPPLQNARDAKDPSVFIGPFFPACYCLGIFPLPGSFGAV